MCVLVYTYVRINADMWVDVYIYIYGVIYVYVYICIIMYVYVYMYICEYEKVQLCWNIFKWWKIFKWEFTLFSLIVCMTALWLVTAFNMYIYI